MRRLFMRLFVLGGALSGWGLTQHVQARDAQPTLLPQRDVQVRYQVAGNVPNLPSAVQAIFKAGGRKLRLESDTQPGPIVIDRDTHQAVMMMPSAHMAVRVGIGAVIDRLLADPQARFQRLGNDLVAGVACTRWALSGEQASGQGCVTSDGVILQVDGTDRKGEQLVLNAVSVAYATQPDELFTVPAGTGTLDLKGLAQSLQLGRGAGSLP